MTTVGARRRRPWSAQVRRGMGLGLVLGTLCGASASDPLKSLLACRDVADATARLACFDRETAALEFAPGARAPAVPSVPSVPAVPSVPSAPRVAPAAPSPAAASPPLDAEQRFGLPERTVAEKEIAAGLRSTEAAKIQAHIAQLSTTGDGRTLFKLDNDQAWRQLLAEGDLLARVGDIVTISRGALGSYWLQDASGRGCKVTRVR